MGLIELLNNIPKELFLEKEIYESEKILSIQLKDNEETRKIMSDVILDLDRYLKENAKHNLALKSAIGLDYLLDEHQKEHNYEIMYDKNKGQFYSSI